jgi:hypothetical protein
MKMAKRQKKKIKNTKNLKIEPAEDLTRCSLGVG